MKGGKIMKNEFYEIAKNAILSEIETRNTQEFLDRIQSNQLIEEFIKHCNERCVDELFIVKGGENNENKKSTIL